MNGLDPRLEPALDRAFRWVERAVEADFGQPPSFTDMLLSRLDALHQATMSDSHLFAPVAIPVALALNDTPLSAAACTAFHLGLGESAEASQVLTAMAFTFLGDLEEAAAAMRTMAFAAKRLAGGRAREVSIRRAGLPVDPPTALLQARLELGSAYACYAQLAAIAGGMPGDSWTSLWSWGEAVGASRQLAIQASGLERQDPEGAAQVNDLVAHLGDEARRKLGGTWLPWGARPILDALVGGKPHGVRQLA